MNREHYDIVIIDFGHLVYRTLFASMNTTDFSLWKQIVWRTLLSNVYKFPASTVVLAAESRDNWRKEIYPDYKGNRAKYRDESPIDFEEFFSVLNTFEESLQEYLPFVFLKVPTAEGDDIVGTVVTENVGKKILIVSSDKDFQHLQIIKNVSQWDPLKKSMKVCKNPKEYLLEMLLTGDMGDNIPPLRRGIGPKTAQKIIAKGMDEVKFFVQREGLEKQYKRNTNLISLFHINPEVKKRIMTKYRSYNKPELRLKTFLAENELWTWTKDEQFYRTEKAMLQLY